MSLFRRLFGADEPTPEAPTPEARPQAPEADADAGDLMVIEQLRQAGADLSRPREVIHYLYMPTEDAANSAADTLRREGYATDVRPAARTAGPNPWLAQATIEQVVTIEAISAARALFTRLATEAGGEYDGWEAAASP